VRSAAAWSGFLPPLSIGYKRDVTSTPSRAATAALVLGTTNAGKVRELLDLLAPHGIACRSLREVTGAVEVEETGGTFAENAALKASQQARALGAWVLAEDSGLVVPALGGEPGVRSARFSGPAPAGSTAPTDERNNDLLLERMAGLAPHDRAAHYACHAALADPAGTVVAVAAGACHGTIATARRGAGGFGYDPLFVVPEFWRTFGEIPPAVKAVISHRARALRAIMPAIVRLVGVVLACLVTGGGVVAQAPVGGAPTDVVATVGATPIFRAELDEVLRRSLAAAAAGGEPIEPGRRSNLEATALEQIVDARLLRAELERQRITVPRADVDTRLAQMKKQVGARGIEWGRFLKQSGREESAIREQIELEIGLDRLIRPQLTPAVIDAGFESHKREIDGTRLRVSHFVLRPDAARGDEGLAALRERAAAIRREIVQGAVSFADAARRHSAGPSRFAGGDLGWIGREGPLVEAFAKQAFELPKGGVSQPFVTPFGVHVVQVTAIEPGRAGLDTLRPKLEALLAEKMLRDTLARVRAATPVSFADGVAHFDPATPAGGDRPRRIVVVGGPATAP